MAGTPHSSGSPIRDPNMPPKRFTLLHHLRAWSLFMAVVVAPVVGLWVRPDGVIIGAFIVLSLILCVAVLGICYGLTAPNGEA